LRRAVASATLTPSYSLDHMRIASTLSVTVSCALLVAARLDCVVKALGRGQDDGPNILKAFKRCKTNGKVVLKDYYIVDTREYHLINRCDGNDTEVYCSFVDAKSRKRRGRTEWY
jgi:hypothetical protein